MPHRLSAPTIGRAILGTATVLFFVIAFAVRQDARWYVAAAGAGALWTLWDLVWEHVLAPLGHWVAQAFSGGLEGPPPNIRPTLDDTIRPAREPPLREGDARRAAAGGDQGRGDLSDGEDRATN